MAQPDTANIVAELWAACHVLRDDGLSSHDYMRELTCLLFLKLMKEVGREDLLPVECRWSTLASYENEGLLAHYRDVLQKLGSQGDPRVRAIYHGVLSGIRSESSLRHVIDRLNRSQWHDDRREGLGDAYEGLLERAAGERKSGAGQYFTPRALVDSIVAVVKPGPGETVMDPACGTAGFLVSVANQEMQAHHGSRVQSSRYVGIELVHDVARLALMNFAVHNMEGDVIVGDSLYEDNLDLPLADVILSNPPFGTRGAPELRYSDAIPIPTRNKQLAFLQLIVHRLRPGGRAAIIVPDNVLFERGVGEAVRTQVIDLCNLHTMLRLPTGIFYAPGIKTNVLFLTRRKEGARISADETIWIYDARSDMPIYGKRQPLTRSVFADFERAFGDDPHGRSARVDAGPSSRFRAFSWRELRATALNLDVNWLAPQHAPSDIGRLTSEMNAALRAASDALAELEAEI